MLETMPASIGIRKEIIIKKIRWISWQIIKPPIIKIMQKMENKGAAKR